MKRYCRHHRAASDSFTIADDQFAMARITGGEAKAE